ncbi:MAG: Rrf2 family transcriptional regulator [Spirochaetaceae bacterium]|jgi:Rrf2 family protein|nr:Rrf2 family transcriptional regulator [Spirochaetaceae bacterium]
MKLSRRGRYGIRLLIDLAQRKNEGLVTLASAAERQHISMRYLEQVAIILRRAGFIRSVKGSAGGYILARAPEDIIIGDALRQLEGDMLIIDPPIEGELETKLQRTVRRVVFDAINERVARVIDRETLASLAGTFENGESYMYFI